MIADGLAIPSRQQVDPAPPEAATPAAARIAGLQRNLAWMIGLRWVAVTGVGSALLVASLTGWVDSLIPPVSVLAALAAFNVVLHILRRTLSLGTRSGGRLETVLAAQLHVDLVALALLVRWTGGLGNPFVLFGVFPVALGAMLLPTRKAIMVGFSALLLFAGLLGCSMAGGRIAGPFRAVSPETFGSPVFVTALLLSATMTIFGIVFFVHSIARQRRVADEDRRRSELIARARERMARVGKLSAGIAHSIRNPLHGVLNCLDLLEDEADDGQRRELIELASGGLRRIESVTSRLLAMTRNSSPKRELVDFNECVRETLELFALRLPKYSIELQQDLGDLPPVCVDPLRVHEALFNVLDNAVDAVKTVGRRRIYVSTSLVDQPFVGACIEVQDTGVGVEEGLAETVFDPFVTTKLEGEGTGLGLAITREAIEEHGGTVQFSSKLGVGTTVRLLLPLDGTCRGPRESDE